MKARTRKEPKKAPVATKKSPQERRKTAGRDGTQAARAVADAEVPWLPIIGIGASAGGLEAIEQFLKNVPSASGLAFVIVQHLDPKHKGMLVELLQRRTTMPVRQITDRTRVQGDHVYVIPPNKDLSLLNGVLHVLPPVAPHGLRLPIDFFLRALADDQNERSIGVILSGMGSDGTLGLRAIKEQAGMTFVQATTSAKFDGMPRSAISAGLADVIANVEDLPGKIVACIQNAPHPARDDGESQESSPAEIEKIVSLLRRHTGHDFSQYKQSTLTRRIERRMALHQLGGLGTYIRYLQGNPDEIQLLFRELLIGVTTFFRDRDVWRTLKESALPALLARRPDGSPLRVWVPGCSTGEEAYSLAVIFKEVLGQESTPLNHALKIFATDLDSHAIEQARQGRYRANAIVDVSAERRRRFFVKEESGYRVGKDVRESVVFATQNLIMDPPFTRLDLISCRNVFIYLGSELQKKLLEVFHYALSPGGILILGTSETPAGTQNLFTSVEGKARIYRRVDATRRTRPVDIPVGFSPPAQGVVSDRDRGLSMAPNLTTLADQLLLQHHTPATIFTNDRGGILYLRGQTSRYLEPPTGSADWNVFTMARGGLRLELASTFRQAIRSNAPVTQTGIELLGEGGVPGLVDVTVEPINLPEGLRGTVRIAFSEGTQPRPVPAAGKTKVSSTDRSAMARLEQELRSTREEMQLSREEMHASQEELQSTNEELQSTNEELTTSKEEMQSMNEELQTLNHELQTKVDDLSRANNDMKNLLESTDIATLFLDSSLHVRRFTAQTTKIFKLIPGDLGRPITDLSSVLLYPELPDDAREVLRTLVPRETPLATDDGRWLAVRVMPYRTIDDKIEGVVITFTDITLAKALESSLRKIQSGLEAKVIKQAAALVRAGLGEDKSKS